MKPRTTPEGSNVHGKKVRHSCRRLLRGALCKESRERLSSILCHFSAMAQWPLSSRLPFTSNHNCASPVTSPELKVFPNSPFVFPSPQSTFLPDPLHFFLLLSPVLDTIRVLPGNSHTQTQRHLLTLTPPSQYQRSCREISLLIVTWVLPQIPPLPKEHRSHPEIPSPPPAREHFFPSDKLYSSPNREPSKVSA